MICQRCVMDDTAKDFILYDDGTCNYCRSAVSLLRTSRHAPGGFKIVKRGIFLARSRGRSYDCLFGLSGGVDSSFALYLAVTEGLNPLCVHVDNGWNSAESYQNIINMTKQLKVDLDVVKLDTEKFNDLQSAFIKAGVPDLEIPTDHILVTLLYRRAYEHGLKYIMAGNNVATESIVPRCWSKGHSDSVYIKNIHRRFGHKKSLSNYHFRRPKQVHHWRKSGRWIPILNYFLYNREVAKKFLIKRYSFQDYGSQHCESVYTRFIQSYVLPRRFNFDKRKAYLSSLIMSQQLSRESALKVLKEKPYESYKLMNNDYTKILDGLGFTLLEFEAALKLPLKFYDDYKHSKIDCDTRRL